MIRSKRGFQILSSSRCENSATGKLSRRFTSDIGLQMYLAACKILEDHDASMDGIQGVFTWISQKRMELNIITLKS
ncbi:hypothetical protein OQZ33_13510 [Pedobacter sp. MC2016-05]|uniref:hypothetical protein n=1 Tax=Pedobacter sp. MC2016-05 TaxID=2994474 RepID=UPI0022473EAF|nr:hypothetical protein [Pedobacter sp. MC2016-05]MCX2475349.1 hypothetical protein [Pedobacter sp. MC2016-05]